MRIQTITQNFVSIASLAICAATITCSAQEEAPPSANGDKAEKELLHRSLNNVSKARGSLKPGAAQAEARPLQKQVVTDLETLIDMLKQNQSPPPPQNSDGSQS